MTVKELIEKLSGVKDQSKRVVISNLGTGWTADIDEIESHESFDIVTIYG